MIFAQIVSDTTEAINTTQQSNSIWNLIAGGGVVMIFIGILLILAIYIFVERLMIISRADQDPGEFMTKVKDLVVRGDIAGAESLCSQDGTPIARMIQKGVSRIGHPLRNIEVSIENMGKIEVFKLEKRLPVLATVAGAAPMLGFLGTVLGMMDTFMAISLEEGMVSPKLLSSGIYPAMSTTIGGLIVGIMAYLAYNFLVSRIQNVIHKWEHTSIDFVELLQEPS